MVYSGPRAATRTSGSFARLGPPDGGKGAKVDGRRSNQKTNAGSAVVVREVEVEGRGVLDDAFRVGGCLLPARHVGEGGRGLYGSSAATAAKKRSAVFARSSLRSVRQD